MASYQPVTQEFLAQLESIVPGRVTAGSEVNPDYGRDEMPIYGVHPPEAAVEILSTEEAAAVVKLCYAHNIPVTTRGAGTGLVGGCVPVFGGVVLSTARMNRILGYDLENFTVTVQPGVLLQQLAEDALSHGCLYPPDPGEKLATLGGNVSTNASGMREFSSGDPDTSKTAASWFGACIFLIEKAKQISTEYKFGDFFRNFLAVILGIIITLDRKSVV